MKQIIKGILAVLLIMPMTSAKAQRVVYDKSKHYQFRSQEIGSWSFRPKIYYNILHRRYKRNFAPNVNYRTPTAAFAAVENEEYKQIKESVAEWQNRETKLLIERYLNMIGPILGAKVKSSQDRFIKNISEYLSIIGAIKDKERSKREQVRAERMINEFYRFMGNIDIIGKSYIDQGKKQEGYIEVVNSIDNLNAVLVAVMKMAYNTKINNHFIK